MHEEEKGVAVSQNFSMGAFSTSLRISAYKLNGEIVREIYPIFTQKKNETVRL